MKLACGDERRLGGQFAIASGVGTRRSVETDYDEQRIMMAMRCGSRFGVRLAKARPGSAHPDGSQVWHTTRTICTHTVGW